MRVLSCMELGYPVHLCAYDLGFGGRYFEVFCSEAHRLGYLEGQGLSK